MLERLRLFPKKAEAPPSAIGPIASAADRPSNSFKGHFAEDLEWTHAYLKQRLKEIADYFAQPGHRRPQGDEPRTYFVQELLSEESVLIGMAAGLDYAISIAPSACDDKKKATFIDAETERQLTMRLRKIREHFDGSGSFRQAKLHRLELPLLRSHVRKEFYR